MSPSLRQAISRDIRRIQDRRDALEIPLEAAAEALRAAAVAHEHLRTEYDAVNEQLQVMKLQLLRTTVSTMPSELLRAIFQQLVFQLDKEGDVDQFLVVNKYNALRVSAPFRLAAVCRRWRDVCMDFPALWSYVGVPEDQDGEENGHRFIMRSTLLLQRSGACPLHVYLSCPDGYDSARFLWFDNVLFELTQRVRRWKYVTIAVPSLTTELSVGFLREPMPLLERLTFCSLNPCDYLPWNSSVYIPCSPHIRYLEFWSMFFMPPTLMLSLASFHVSVTRETYGLLWSTLEMMPNLDDLSIDFANDVEPVALANVISLTSVTRLYLQGFFGIVDTWLNYLEIPRLTVFYLVVDHDTYIDSIMAFVLAKCASIKDLYLKSGLHMEDIPVASFMPLITALPQLQILHLVEWKFPDDLFFSTLSSNLAGNDSLMVPNSTVIRDLRRIELSDVHLSFKASDALCNLVRRQMCRAEVNQFSIFILNTDASGLPPWAHRQLMALLGDAYVIKPELPADGLVLDAAVGSDEESEAAFTNEDSDSDSEGTNINDANFDADSSDSEDSD